VHPVNQTTAVARWPIHSSRYATGFSATRQEIYVYKHFVLREEQMESGEGEEGRTTRVEKTTPVVWRERTASTQERERGATRTVASPYNCPSGISIQSHRGKVVGGGCGSSIGSIIRPHEDKLFSICVLLR